jgi:hypothetical protein
MSDGNLSGFNANDVDPNSKFDVIPAGEYDVVIVSSEVKTTTKGDGKYLSLEMQVLNGEYQNRKLFDNLNLWNPSDEAQKIARGTLSAICRAVGVMTPGDSSDLHNKPLRVKVVVKKDTEFGEQNKVKGYKARNGAPVAATAASGGTAPWPTEAAADTQRQAAQRF